MTEGVFFVSCNDNLWMMATLRELIIEVALFILLYGFDIGTDISVLLEAQRTYNDYRSLFQNSNDSARNESKQIGFCSSGPWNTEDYQRNLGSFDSTLIAMKVFLTLASFLFLLYLALHIWIIHLVIGDPDLEEHEIEKYITAKFVFGLTCSMVQDISLTSLSVDLFVKRTGPKGLICWGCYYDETCVNKYILGKRFDHTTTLLAISLTAVVILSLYKGFVIFYRWSRVDECHCYEIRACVSLFVGGCFALVVLTPCLALFKFAFFTLPSESENVFSGITDRLFMIGVMIWGVFIVIAFCCPLLRLCLRKSRKAWQNVLCFRTKEYKMRWNLVHTQYSLLIFVIASIFFWRWTVSQVDSMLEPTNLQWCNFNKYFVVLAKEGVSIIL